MNEICSIEKCTGCNLCASVCPRQCIDFTKEYNGHVYPVIDSEKCIDCGKCVKKCISNQDNIVKHSADYGCFAAWHKDLQEQYESASAGLATTISRYVIKQGGKVYGCAVDEHLKAVHIGVETEEDLEKLRKSKYSLSHISKDVFEDIRTTLKADRLCLFVGVGCQCDAVRRFLGKEYNNLIIIDLLCHGGASPSILAHHINFLCNEHNLCGINNVTFRGGDSDCKFTLRHNKEVRFSDGQYRNEYFLGFMKHILYRKSCFNCQYATKERVGDITLADFWGLDSKLVEQHNFHKLGVNLVLVNTDKGKVVFDAIKDEINVLQRNVDEAVAGNETLQCPTPMPSNYEHFWELMEAHPFEKSMHIAYKKHYDAIRLHKIKYCVFWPLYKFKNFIVNRNKKHL